MLELNHISKKYTIEDNSFYALKDINLKIEQGEFVAIMGASGSGKSTLLNIIGLLDVADSGSYKIKDKESTTLSSNELARLRLKTIGFVFQQFNLLTKLTAYENVCLPLIYADKKAASSKDYADELLKRLGLEKRAGHFPNQLSGGQQQRVAIARSLINRPLMILADEPTGNLDSQSEKDILTLFKQLNDEGITIVVVTHDESVANVAKRIVKMKDGVIISDERHQESQGNDQSEQTNHLAHKPFFSFPEFSLFIQQSLKTLLRSKMRTLLSMLGILIGVASVIAMLAIGNGAQKSIEMEFSTLGTNVLVLKNGTSNVTGPSAPKLTLDDGDFLKENIPEIHRLSPLISGTRQVLFKNKSATTKVIGASVELEKIRNLTPLYGRFFTQREDDSRARVALIGYGLYRKLFKGKNPIGERIKVDKNLFQVIGILPEKGSDGQTDRDNVVIIPINTVKHRLIVQNFVDSFDIEIFHKEKMQQTEKDILKLVTTRHKLPISQKMSAFEVKNMASILKAMNKSNQTMFFLLSAIATISLVVGGIGIMNVMLASISERTKEIGLRKAVGGQDKDILFQFLIEAIAITILGGSIGVAMGIAASYLISFILSWPVYISLFSVFISLFFAAMTGSIFGFFPAKKAASLHPIDALKSN